REAQPRIVEPAHDTEPGDRAIVLADEPEHEEEPEDLELMDEPEEPEEEEELAAPPPLPSKAEPESEPRKPKSSRAGRDKKKDGPTIVAPSEAAAKRAVAAEPAPETRGAQRFDLPPTSLFD